jgi:hypothetical protein
MLFCAAILAHDSSRIISKWSKAAAIHEISNCIRSD